LCLRMLLQQMNDSAHIHAASRHGQEAKEIDWLVDVFSRPENYKVNKVD